jgi:hypothetical protein
MEEVDGFEADNLVVRENPRELEEFRNWLLATAWSLKEKEHQIKEEQDAINNRWTSVIAAELQQEARPHEPKSYPCRKMFPSLDEEEHTPRRPDPYRPDRPPRGCDRPFTQAEDPPILRRKGKEPMDPNNLCNNLNARTQTRSMYGP